MARSVTVVEVDFGSPASPDTVEWMIARVMRECRRRLGMTPAAFAWAINAASPRNPGLMAESILAYEEGRAAPGAAELWRALALAGYDVAASTRRWCGEE